MVSVNVSLGEKPITQAQEKLLEDICKEAQPHFTNPLVVEKCFGDSDGPMYGFFYLITEVNKRRLLGIVPQKKRRTISRFESYTSTGSRLECEIYEESILEIVKEKLAKFAEEFDAISVEITTQFATI